MNNKKKKLSELREYLVKTYNATFYNNLNEAKKFENLVPKEFYDNISVCSEFSIKDSDNYACFAVTTEYSARELIVASYYNNQTIKYIFVPYGMHKALQDIYKFMPFYSQLNSYSKEDFFADVDKILHGERKINCKKFYLLMHELYNAKIVDDLTKYQEKLSVLGILPETYINKNQTECKNLIYKISGEKYCIPDEEECVLVAPHFSNDKLISVIYTSSFKYYQYLDALTDIEEGLRCLCGES